MDYHLRFIVLRRRCLNRKEQLIAASADVLKNAKEEELQPDLLVGKELDVTLRRRVAALWTRENPTGPEAYVGPMNLKYIPGL